MLLYIIAVPSIFTVAPRGTVKDETRLSTPIRFCIPIVTGMVAFEDAVEKANIMASFIFLMKKVTELSPVKPLSIKLYVTKPCKSNVPDNTRKYSARLKTKRQTKTCEQLCHQKEDTVGAKYIEIATSFIITSLRSEKDAILSPGLPAALMAIPNRTIETIT